MMTYTDTNRHLLLTDKRHVMHRKLEIASCMKCPIGGFTGGGGVQGFGPLPQTLIYTYINI